TVMLYTNSIEFARSSTIILESVYSVNAAAFKADLRGFDEVGHLLDAQLHGRWGQVVAILARHVDENCNPGSCESLVKRLGTVAAMLTAGDNGEEIEAVLRAAANPPGGWRSKAKRGRFTVSVAAFPGLYGAMEWRWGPYGAVVERGGQYWQAPTVAMPIGVDFAWGKGKKDHDAAVVGLFVSIIDPAAFLGYDMEEQGKLPGPRLTTVLSPGVGFRVTPPRSPFTLMLPYINFRPQYRTWEATLDGPGASVVHVGVNFAVDVTLWTIVSGGKK
ncbi:MAG: hypothetical protein R6X02_36060, partial [Enhygromyxa sp.]